MASELTVDLAARVTVMTAEDVCVDVAAELILFTPMSTHLLLVCRLDGSLRHGLAFVALLLTHLPQELNYQTIITVTY